MDWFPVAFGAALVMAAWVYAATGWPMPGLVRK
jgi:hypothetical protein